MASQKVKDMSYPAPYLAIVTSRRVCGLHPLVLQQAPHTGQGQYATVSRALSTTSDLKQVMGS